MIHVKQMAAQGDVIFRRVEAIPNGFTEQPETDRVIVAHSQTGHDHSIDHTGVRLYEGADALRCYLRLEGVDEAVITHHRSFDTHEALCLGGGEGAIWEVIRQREYTPEGWRRVED